MTLQLGETSIGRIGYGAMRLPGVREVPENSKLACELLAEAISLGANVIDTADFYGQGVANRLIARALAPYSEKLIISTKVGVRAGAGGRPEPAATPKEIRATVKRNLEQLETESLDLVFLRLAGGPLAESGVPIQASMECLSQLQEEGIVKHIGLSSATIEQVEAAKKIAPIEAIQNSFFVGCGGPDSVMELCANEGIPFFAYFPLGMGKLIQQKVDLRPYADAHKASASQIALAWLLALSPVLVPIPGTSNLEHLRENFDAIDVKLSSEEVEALANFA